MSGVRGGGGDGIGGGGEGDRGRETKADESRLEKLPEELQAALVTNLPPFLEAVKKLDGSRVLVAADMGGTNLRLVIVPAAQCRKGDTSGAALIKLPCCKSTRNVASGIAAVGGAIRETGATLVVEGAAMAVAGPVEDNKVTSVANFLPGEHMHLGEPDLDSMLFPAGRTRFLNDMVACCEGILWNGRHDQLKVGFTTLWKPDGIMASSPADRLENRSYICLNLGTGLGNAAMVWDPLLRRHTTLPLEAGHGTVVTNTESADFLKSYSARCASVSTKPDEWLCEWDDVCSGRGLVALYTYFHSTASPELAASVPPALDAPAIGASWKTNEVSRLALLGLFRSLMRFAQNLVIAVQAHGIVLAGENQVHNSEFVAAHTKELCATFVDHSMDRMKFQSRVSVIQQTGPMGSLGLNLAGGLRSADAASTCPI